MSFKLICTTSQRTLRHRFAAPQSTTLDARSFVKLQIAPHLIATALLMNCSADEHNIIGRFKTVLLDRALCFAPLYSAATNSVGERQ